MSRFAVVLVTVAVVLAAAAGTAHAVGGGLRETLASVTGPDLLDEPRAVAGLVAAGAVLAGGLGVLLTIVNSLQRPAADDYDVLALRLENALTRLELRAVDGHVLVCGAGALGHAVADELASRGIDGVVLERDPARARRARIFLPFLIEGDPRDDETLRRAGAGRARAVIACAERERDNDRIAAAAARLELPFVRASEWPDAAAVVDALTAAARR